ncbi:Undecaprenyl-phosphate 4-deoxy-4-formamido-L-arabinose transferase [subsurface metagenome]
MNSKNKPKVSVIIPLYNQKQYVGEAIESILNQTYPNIEIIVVNDGSTDNPFSVLEKYKKNIILINQENKGLAAARNTGLKNCSGEYIQFLDADDFLHKNKIKLQLEFSEIQDNTVSYCEIARYYDDSKHISSRNVGEIEDIFLQYYNFWNLYPTPIHSLLFKKEIFKKFGLFDEELKANEDRHYLSKLAVAGIVFKYFPFIGGFYRLHELSLNTKRLHIIENTIRYYQKLNKELGDNYFIEKIGFTGYQMMCANLTYVYLGEVARGMRRKELKRIRKLLRKEGIKFDAEPIPSHIKKFKLERMFLDSYLRRGLRYFIIIKRSFMRMIK